jgi:hypothetical protein
MSFLGMWRRVVLVWTDVSEERIASIFRAEKSAREELAWAGGCSLQPPGGKVYAPAAFYPQENSWYLFLLKTESTPGP